LSAGEQLEQRLEWHRLDAMEVVEKAHYERPGKPKAGTLPTRITYHLQATPGLREEVVATHRRRAGRFILATNVMDSEHFSDEQLLHEIMGNRAMSGASGFLKTLYSLPPVCFSKPRSGLWHWLG